MCPGIIIRGMTTAKDRICSGAPIAMIYIPTGSIIMFIRKRLMSCKRNDANITQIQCLSVFLSLVLRHKPDAAGIQLDEHGWANVNELIDGVNSTGRRIDRESLERIVVTDEKGRYSFNEDKTLIRANQGHSVVVDVELKEQEPPEFLYHGTAERFMENILTKGLKPMNRLYVHLSKDKETAVKVGKRHGKPVILKVHSGKMYKAGNKFYLSENGVWLTKSVSAEYFSIVEE